MNILIINCGSRAIKKLQSISEKLGAKTTLLSIDALPPKSLKDYDGIIISGSPLMWSKCKGSHLKRFNWIKRTNKPVLGVCFGHQTISLLYGSSIRHEKLLKRKIFINIKRSDLLIKSLNKQALFMEYHKEYISLPKGFKLIATSSSGNIEAIKHPTKPIYGIQFHPELSGRNGEIILKNFFNICNN